MKIIHVIPFYAPAWGYGGPVRVCYDLCTESAKRGNDVSVWTTDAYDHLSRIDKVCEEMNGVKIRRFKNLSNRLAKGYNLYLPKGFKKYCKLHIKEYDVVHLHSFYTALNVSAAKYARKYKIPYIIHFHESIRPTPERGKSWVKKLFIYLWGNQMLEGARSIIVLSRGELEELRQFNPKFVSKAVIVANPGPEWKGKNKNQSEIRKKYGYGEKDKLLLSLSRLGYLKGIDLLINTFDQVHKIDPSFKLIIAGPSEPGIDQALEKQCGDFELDDSIAFRGMVSGQEKDDLYSIADLYCLFSRYEPFGVTILEAISHQLPAVLSKGVGIGRELEIVGCAKVVDTSKPSKAAKIIIECFKNRTKMQSNCREALINYSISDISSKILDLYKNA